MPNYPAQIDTSLSLPTAVDNLTPVQGSIFNKLRNAVIAIESELGVKPSSVYSTVKVRLDVLEGIIGNLQIIELAGDLGGTLDEPLVIGIQGRPVSDVLPDIDDVLSWNGVAWVPAAGGGGGGGGGETTTTGTAGENISQGELVAWDVSSGAPRVFKADADGAGELVNTVGVATESASSGEQVTVALAGDVGVPDGQWDSIPTSSDIGKLVFLSSVAGNWTLTAPTTPGSYSQKCGIITNTSGTVRVAIQIGDSYLN